MRQFIPSFLMWFITSRLKMTVLLYIIPFRFVWCSFTVSLHSPSRAISEGILYSPPCILCMALFSYPRFSSAIVSIKDQFLMAFSFSLWSHFSLWKVTWDPVSLILRGICVCVRMNACLYSQHAALQRVSNVTVSTMACLYRHSQCATLWCVSNVTVSMLHYRVFLALPLLCTI